MNGTYVVFDTNALINFFNVHSGLQRYAHFNVALSIINLPEFLSYPKITNADEVLLFRFLKKVDFVNLDFNNTSLIQQTITIRKSHKLKLPDAIIAATALLRNTQLVTNDKDFRKVPNLKVSI